MIFTTRVRSDAGIPLEDLTEDRAFQALLKGKNILYVLSTRLDGPNVSKFGVAHLFACPAVEKFCRASSAGGRRNL